MNKIAWKEIRQTILYYINNAKSISTLREGISFIYDIFLCIYSGIVKYTSTKDHPANYVFDSDRRRRMKNDELIHIACSPTSFYVYIVIACAMITHNLYILHGLSILVVGYIMMYVIKWMIYTLDDPELYNCYIYFRGWVYLLLHEGEDIISGDAAWKLATTYIMINQAPTGISYIRYIIRYKTRLLRKQFIMELGGNRFGGGRRFIQLASSLTASLTKSKHDGDKKSSMFSDDDGYYEELWFNEKDVELVLQKKKR
jgi:hypothetical protein